MEAYFYTNFLPKIEKIEKNEEIIDDIWVTSNNYNDISIFLKRGCAIKYSTYPKYIVDLNKNWKRLKLNWYILYCN